MRPDFAQHIARTVIHRPALVMLAALCLLAACVGVISSKPRLDSEVLNLLPQDSPAIQALKVFNTEFRQGRELIFALQGPAEANEEVQEAFVEKLRAQPWVERVFAGSPMESPEELAMLHALLPQLLLNLDDEAFAAAVASLAPPALEERVRRLRNDIESGSPRAEMEVTVDPLGIASKAMAPMAGLDDSKSHVLASPDGTLRIFPVVTTQPSLSQADCKAIMAEVEKFTAAMRQQWSGGAAPEILVTGRSAYVAQIAGSMERDVRVTSTISILAVTGLFFIGFRRWIPPLATTLILSATCFITFTIGCVLFENLNLIAIAFCSILVGLGDDFSLLLYNRYLLARTHAESHEQAVATSIREMGPGIVWVALTTGAGFLVLWFSSSGGFAQLGTLIAVGVVLCAGLMIGLLFLFIRPQHAHPERSDPLHGLFDRLAGLLVHVPARVGLPMLVIALAAVIVAVLPARPLEFDTSPRSLEPKQIPAAIALRTIHDNLPATSEPIALLLEASDAQTAHRNAAALEQRLKELVSAGTVESFSSPAALILSPERLQHHREVLKRSVNIEASRAAFTKALQAAGFEADAFRAAFTFFDQLAIAAESTASSLDVQGTLPRSSSWWFLLDRYLSTRPLLATAYVRAAKPLDTPPEQAAFEEAVRRSGVPLQITGWNYAMVGIVPWAQRELLVFSAAVGLLIVGCLALAYRRWTPLLVHLASLVFALGACVTLLKLTGTKLNMLNALALPLVLGVGVDYGMHLLLALKEGTRTREHLTTVLKPVVISGLTTIAGFGALVFAQNPALKGLGTVCGLGVASCLVASVLFAVPVMAWIDSKRSGRRSGEITRASADR